MKLFVPLRIKFHGPDPPPVILEPVPEPVEVDVRASQAKKGKVEAVVPVEIPKTPEQLAVEKMFSKFMK